MPHDWRMTSCILDICLVAGGVADCILSRNVSPITGAVVAFSIFMLCTVHKKEVKKLVDKIFNNDKFDGGSLGGI